MQSILPCNMQTIKIVKTDKYLTTGVPQKVSQSRRVHDEIPSMTKVNFMHGIFMSLY